MQRVTTSVIGAYIRESVPAMEKVIVLKKLFHSNRCILGIIPFFLVVSFGVGKTQFNAEIGYNPNVNKVNLPPSKIKKLTVSSSALCQCEGLI